MYGSPQLLRILTSGLNTSTKEERNAMFFPTVNQALDAVQPIDGWSKVKVPGITETHKHHFVVDYKLIWRKTKSKAIVYLV